MDTQWVVGIITPTVWIPVYLQNLYLLNIIYRYDFSTTWDEIKKSYHSIIFFSEIKHITTLYDVNTTFNSQILPGLIDARYPIGYLLT